MTAQDTRITPSLTKHNKTPVRISKLLSLLHGPKYKEIGPLLRVEFYLGNKLTEGIKDELDSCGNNNNIYLLFHSAMVNMSWYEVFDKRMLSSCIDS